MRRFRRVYCILFALAVLLVSGCRSRARVIPASEFSEIYAEMLLADQWIAQNGRARRTADTTAFYRPILEKYGYSVEDYDASVAHYLRTPEKYAKILKATSASLNARAKRLQSIEDAIAKQPHFSAYTPLEFRFDTLVFRDSTGLWPNDSSFRVAERDSSALQLDSLEVGADSLLFKADSPVDEADSLLFKADSARIRLPQRDALRSVGSADSIRKPLRGDKELTYTN